MGRTILLRYTDLNGWISSYCLLGVSDTNSLEALHCSELGAG
jgi:hypothetical protein